MGINNVFEIRALLRNNRSEAGGLVLAPARDEREES
jgi:hypothetical protein